MSQLLTHLQAHAQAPMGHVYIIGAGDGSQLPQWRALNAQQLWLAEAHPTLSSRLLARTQGHEHETVTQAAITGQAEEHANLHLLNLPGKSSLSAPTQLNHYFPNVQEEGRQQVAAQALSAWATHTSEDTSHEHLLVIDSPGQAHQLISDTPANVLQQFTWVHITAAEEALYEQDAPLSEIDKLLQQRGYNCCKEDADTHYPFIARLYQRQPSVVERLALEATIAALREEVAQAQADAEEANEATATAKSEAEKLAKELEEARVIARSEATKQSQALEAAQQQLAERDQQLSEKTKALEEARTTAKSEAEKLAKALEETRATAKSEATKQSLALEAAQKQLAERDQQLSEKTKDLEDTLAARDTANSEAAKHSQALETTQKQLAERDEGLKQRTQEREAARKQNEDNKKALDEKNKQLNERDEQIKQRTQERDKARQLADEHKQACEKAHQVAKNQERENQELQHRQQLLQDELVKGEAQIELIKDLLLREPGL